MKARTLKLSDVEKSDSFSLYVINNYQNQGDVNFTVQMEGKSIAIKVPKTWIPIDLTTFAPRKNVIASHEFRRMIRMEVLKIIHPEDAEKILDSEEAIEEVKRLNKNIFEEHNLKVSTVDDTIEQKKEDLYQGKYDKLDYNPKMVMALAREDIDDSRKLSILKTLETELTNEDYKYILTNTTNKKIKKWAKAQIK